MKRPADIPASERRPDLRRDPILARKLGRKLREIRRQLDLPQTLWAYHAKLTRAQLSNIEQGRVLPSIPALYRLAAAIHAKPGELLP